jgi:hypothetical protein
MGLRHLPSGGAGRLRLVGTILVFLHEENNVLGVSPRGGFRFPLRYADEIGHQDDP